MLIELSAAAAHGPALRAAAAAAAWLIALVCCSALHLFASAKYKEGLRRVTKALLVPLVICAHIAIAGLSYPLVICALVCGWVGDILLIPRGRKLFFGVGALFFLVGHCLYIAAAFSAGLPQATYSRFGWPSAAAAATAALIMLGLAFASFYAKLPAKMRIPCIVYMAGIASMAATLAYSAVGDPRFPKLLAAFGGALFVVSDYILAGSMIGVIKGRRRSLAVMFTYILAQAFIALGFALL